MNEDIKDPEEAKDKEIDEKFEEEQKKKIKKSNNVLLFLIIGLVVVFLILFLIPAITNTIDNEPVTLDEMFKRTLRGEESEENYAYNGFAFVKVKNLWYTNVLIKEKQFQIPLHYSPREVENITIAGSINDTFHSSKVYVTFDPSDEYKFAYTALSAAELSLNLVKAFGVTPIAACTSNITEGCMKRPIVTCEPGNKAVIYLKEDNETMLGLNGNCIVIQGKDEEMVKVTDRLIYQWYGVMQ